MVVVTSRFAATLRLAPTLLTSVRSRVVNCQAIRVCSSNSSKPSRQQQLKSAVSQYGSTVIVFHVAISLASLGLFYIVVSSGVDVVSLVQKIPYIGDKMMSSSVATGASTFVMAYAVHKVFAPVRISITLTSVPFIVRYLRLKGILKAPVK